MAMIDGYGGPYLKDKNMNGDNKAWTLVIFILSIVLVVLISTLGYNWRTSYAMDIAEREAATTQANQLTEKAIAAGLCQVLNVGSNGYHWDKCAAK